MKARVEDERKMEDAKAAVNGVEYDVESDDDEPREIVNVKVDDGDEDEEEQDGSGDDEGEEEEDGSDDDEDEEDSDDDDDEEAASDEVGRHCDFCILYIYVYISYLFLLEGLHLLVFFFLIIF